MTMRLPGQSEGSMVKGLAKLRNRLRHDRKVKHVDASPCTVVKGGYSPMTERILPAVTRPVYCYLPSTWTALTGFTKSVLPLDFNIHFCEVNILLSSLFKELYSRYHSVS
jgi:hypothetical protein